MVEWKDEKSPFHFIVELLNQFKMAKLWALKLNFKKQL